MYVIFTLYVASICCIQAFNNMKFFPNCSSSVLHLFFNIPLEVVSFIFIVSYIAEIVMLYISLFSYQMRSKTIVRNFNCIYKKYLHVDKNRCWPSLQGVKHLQWRHKSVRGKKGIPLQERDTPFFIFLSILHSTSLLCDTPVLLLVINQPPGSFSLLTCHIEDWYMLWLCPQNCLLCI